MTTSATSAAAAGSAPPSSSEPEEADGVEEVAPPASKASTSLDPSAKEHEIKESKALLAQLRQDAAAKDAAAQAVEAGMADAAEAAKHAALDAEASLLRTEIAAMLKPDSPGASFLPCHTPKTGPAPPQLSN
jgi:hypothetical protein